MKALLLVLVVVLFYLAISGRLVAAFQALGFNQAGTTPLPTDKAKV